MWGAALKNHNVNRPRRQSLRLRRISAIYEADFEQQTHEGNSCVATKIKGAVPEPEECRSPCKSRNVNDATNSGNTKNCESQDNIQGGDFQSPRDITLNDLKARWKAKKRKVQVSAISTEADLKNNTNLDTPQKGNHAHVKLKEEEPDLDEPLITLKMKHSKTSSADRKRRRHSCITSESLVSVQGIDTCSHSSPSNAAPTSLPVATVKASDVNRLSMNGAADLLELISTTDSAGENFGVITEKNLVETVNSLPPSATDMKREILTVGSPELAYNVKIEITEADSSNGQNTDDVTSSSRIDSINNFQNPDNSSTGSPLKVSEGESDNGESPCSQIKFLHSCANQATDIAGPHNENPQLVCSVKSEILESDSSPHVNPFYNADSSALDTIAKFNYPERVSADLLLRVDYASENGELTPLFNKLPYCCLNEASTEYDEAEEHSAVSESVKPYVSEIRKMNLSEMLSNKISPSSVLEHHTDPSDVCSLHSASATMVPDSDSGSSGNYTFSQEVIQENPVNQMDCLAVIHSRDIMEISTIDVCASSRVSEKSGNITDDHSLLCKEVYKLGDMSSSSNEAECCNNFIHGIIPENVQINAKNSSVYHRGDSSRKETSNVCSALPSHAFHCAANDSDAIDNILVANDTNANFEEIFSSMIEQKLNNSKDKTVCDSVKNSKLNVMEGLTGAQSCHFPIFPPCLNASNGFSHVDDSLPRAAKRLPSSSLLKKLHSITDQLTSSEICHLSDIEGNNMEKEGECDRRSIAEQTPKKLLSNRKVISPTSQEKLCQALDDIDLRDPTRLLESRKRLWFEKTIKTKTSSSISGSVEAEEFLAPEQIIKRPKITRNGSLPPIAKGILRSPETSCKRPFSCMNSSPNHIQSEKAIEFSQRQMRDIENIATKLLKGLKSMKNIVEEIVCSEASSYSPKFSVDEIRAEVGNASEIEKTTNKWLSMMAKDCNRFCKIMRSTENKAVTPVNGSRKGRKKIIFADEAGGMLCHVKVFDQRSVSVVPENEG